jgi:SGNH domain (fused to AT3 domains)
VVAVSWLVAAVVLTVAVGAAASTSSPAPTNAAVTGAIKSALKVTTLPSGLTPSLAAIASEGPIPFLGVSFLNSSCGSGYGTDATDPKPCWFGPTSAKRTIVLFGDSFVGSWIPALNIVATSLRYRLAVFEFSGCVTPFLNLAPSPGFPEAEVQLCAEWHKNLPASVKKLKPSAVIAANGSPDWGRTANQLWVTGMKLAFKELTAGTKAHKILLGSGPHLASSAPECLSANPTAIQDCTLSYRPTASDFFGAALIRDKAGAKASGAVLVPTVQWFCAKDRCPVVVGKRLVYIDANHATIVYSEYLSTVLRQALSKVF